MATQDSGEQKAIEIYDAPPPVAVVDEDPMAQVERGKRQAEALMTVVEKAGSFAVIQGNRYLKVEGWELIGRFNQVSAIAEYVKKLLDEDKKLLGYEAKVNLHREHDGQIVGSATMVCGIDEFVTQGKTGLAKDNACMSMAQTRATSKAYRLNFSWVAVLAGFEATPAEEMQGQSQGDTNSKSNANAYACPKHQGKTWFKSAKMKEYAHPMGQGERWCNMDVVMKAAKPTSSPPELDEAHEGYMKAANEQGAEAGMGEFIAEEDAAYQKHLEDSDPTDEEQGDLPW